MDCVTREEADQYMRDQRGDLMPTGGVPPQLITDTSRRLAEFCSRGDWGPAISRTEYKDGGGRSIMVDVWPIASITSISEDTDHLWPSVTVLDSTVYWYEPDSATSPPLGIVYYEGGRFVRGTGTVKIIYAGGYASVAGVPERVKTACLLQLKYEVQRPTPLPETGRAEAAAMDVTGILAEVRAMLAPYKRMVPFA